jgi:hypothetical protein
MRRLLLLLLPVCLMAQTPSLSTYKAGLVSIMAAMRAQVTPLPQPKIIVSGQHEFMVAGRLQYDRGVPCVPGSTCIWNNATVLNSYMDALKRNGQTTFDANIEVLPFRAAAEYSGSLPSDCTGGAKLALNGAPSGGYDCNTLAVYDAVLVHAAAIGMSIRFAPAPTAYTVAYCALTSSSTEADLESCFVPLYVALAKRYPAVQSLTALHEIASGGAWAQALPFTLSVTDSRTFINSCVTALHAANAALKVGAGADTMFPTSEFPYVSDWWANSTADFIGLDVYPASWDVTLYCCDTTTPLGKAAGWAAAIIAAGKEARVNEFNRPPWVATGQLPMGSNAIYGNGHTEWAADGLEILFNNAFAQWASAQGFTSVSVFETNAQIWTTTDTAHDDQTDAVYMTNLIAHLGESNPVGRAYKGLGQWNAGSLQGCGRLTGHVRVGR